MLVGNRRSAGRTARTPGFIPDLRFAPPLLMERAATVPRQLKRALHAGAEKFFRHPVMLFHAPRARTTRTKARRASMPASRAPPARSAPTKGARRTAQHVRTAATARPGAPWSHPARVGSAARLRTRKRRAQTATLRRTRAAGPSYPPTSLIGPGNRGLPGVLTRAQPVGTGVEATTCTWRLPMYRQGIERCC